MKSLVFAIGWTGRCCLYPLVSRGNWRWLGTVSFTTNLSCLQPKAPNRHRRFRVFELHTRCLHRWEISAFSIYKGALLLVELSQSAHK